MYLTTVCKRVDIENAWSCTKIGDIKPNCYGNFWENNCKGAELLLLFFFCTTRLFHFSWFRISEHETYFFTESGKITYFQLPKNVCHTHIHIYDIIILLCVSLLKKKRNI